MHTQTREYTHACTQERTDTRTCMPHLATHARKPVRLPARTPKCPRAHKHGHAGGGCTKDQCSGYTKQATNSLCTGGSELSQAGPNWERT